MGSDKTSLYLILLFLLLLSVRYLVTGWVILVTSIFVPTGTKPLWLFRGHSFGMYTVSWGDSSLDRCLFDYLFSRKPLAVKICIIDA
jgi:hypothetical protein